MSELNNLVGATLRSYQAKLELKKQTEYLEIAIWAALDRLAELSAAERRFMARYFMADWWECYGREKFRI